MTQPRKVLVGAVNYLNTKPLVYDFERIFPRAQLDFDLPSRLADRLAAGQLDVALIPSIELFQDPTYRVISDACIACRGPVLSVKLFSRVPAHKIRTLALDDGSRTSVALARILLKEQYDLQPELVRFPIGCRVEDCRADAALLIGDRAIHSPFGRYCEVWDLGDEWCRWARLPFVFAMWVAREDLASDELEEALMCARDQGLAHLEQIAETEGPAVGLTRPQCLSYLKDHLHFVMGDLEKRGLERFYDYAAQLGLAPLGVCGSVGL